MRDCVEPLPADEQRQARAVKQAIAAAEGLEPCAQDTGKSLGQLSRCASPNYHHSLSIRDAAIIEAIGHGKNGHPHITRLMCRLSGGVFVLLPETGRSDSALLLGLNTIVAELGDVSREVTQALSDDDDIDAAEARRVLLQVDELDAAVAGVRLHLQAIAGTAPLVRATGPP